MVKYLLLYLFHLINNCFQAIHFMNIFCCNLLDLDECQSPDACGANHVCNNTVGSYRCACPIGFVADSGAQDPLAPVCIGTKSRNLEESSNTVKYYTIVFLFCGH